MVPNELIDRFLTGLSHDLPTFMTVFTDDIVYFDVPLLAEMKGKEELKNFAVAFFAAFPDVQFTRTSPPVV
ncbi:nuclear transport factor 2 family protein, partial [Burkholderia cenocepacia]